MTSDDRTEWLKVARMTLADVPADLLARGCEVARRKCDHPAKVVPAILDEIEMALRFRRERLAPVVKPARQAKAEPEPGYVDPAEVRKLIQSIAA